MDLDKAGYSELSMIADSMSPEPVPRREMKNSVEWLIKNGLVEGKNFFRLTLAGADLFASATRETKLMPEVWNKLERFFAERLMDYAPPAEE
jgi:hypothetical protein